MWHAAYGRDWKIDKDQPVKLEWPLLRRVFSYFGPYKVQAAVVLVCIVVVAALGNVPAYVQQQLVNRAFRVNSSFTLVLELVLLWFGTSALSGLIGVLESYLQTRISESIKYDIRNQMFRSLLNQSIGFFTKSKTGDVMSRIQNDVGGVDSVISSTLFDLASNVAVIVTTAIVMFRFNWILALVSLAILPLFVLPTQRVGSRTFGARKEVQEKVSQVNSYLAESLGISGILLIKAFVKGPAERKRFGKLSSELRDLNVSTAMIGRWFWMTISLVSASRFPAGSSAYRILGWLINARARATRCCSPPESCTG